MLELLNLDFTPLKVMNYENDYIEAQTHLLSSALFSSKALIYSHIHNGKNASQSACLVLNNKYYFIKVIRLTAAHCNVDSRSVM